MTTVSDVLSYINSVAPPYMRESWDNVGLLCGSGRSPVTRILVALDPFEDVCQEAIEVNAELIVTHHPLIFTPLKAVTEDTATGRAIGALCAHHISAINAHTNLDCASAGVNDCLAAKLGLEDVQPILMPGKDFGLLRQGTVAQQALTQFLAHVKTALGCEGLRYVNGGVPVRRVAVGGGACGSMLRDAFDAGCDTFVTSDIRYNQFWDAYDLGMNLIDAGHFCTENPVVFRLAEGLREAFPQLSVLVSKKHTDCMKFF